MFVFISLILLFTNKHLSVIPVVNDTNTDMSKVGVQDVFSMTFRVHQTNMGTIYATMFCDVLACCPVLDSKALHHVEGAAIGWGSMREIVVVLHILGLDSCNTTQFRIYL